MGVMKKKVWKLPLIAWLIIAMSTGLAGGAIVYTVLISGTIVIEPPPEGAYEIGVFSDAACTQELVSIDFGTARAGESVPVSFFVKNTGSVTVGVKLTIIITGLTSANYGDIITNLAPGQTRYVDQNLHIGSTAGPGTYSVEMKLEAFA